METSGNALVVVVADAVALVGVPFIIYVGDNLKESQNAFPDVPFDKSYLWARFLSMLVRMLCFCLALFQGCSQSFRQCRPRK